MISGRINYTEQSAIDWYKQYQEKPAPVETEQHRLANTLKRMFPVLKGMRKSNKNATIPADYMLAHYGKDKTNQQIADAFGIGKTARKVGRGNSTQAGQKTANYPVACAAGQVNTQEEKGRI